MKNHYMPTTRNETSGPQLHCTLLIGMPFKEHVNSSNTMISLLALSCAVAGFQLIPSSYRLRRYPMISASCAIKWKHKHIYSNATAEPLGNKIL